ncbi:MAG: adenylate kinase [Candidatus Diapherotrites archaeon]|nr:adenylate kinase [Candidatus Diapherotrites archaeon]
MIAAVVGVPGSGKSTVIAEALKEISIPVVNYGDVFLEVARKKYGIEDRDELRRRLTAEEYKELHREAAKKVLEMAREPIVLDTHALVVVKTGFMPGFPKFVLDMLPISLIVIIEASPEEVLARRKRDARRRGGGLEDNVSLHQELNRAAAVHYAIEKGASVYIIHNKEGEQARSGRELAEVLREWMRGLGYHS